MKFEKVSVVGVDSSLEGMRYSFSNTDRNDSSFKNGKIVVGPQDSRLIDILINGRDSEAKFSRFAVVYVDITAPLYWWKEFDTYRMGVEKLSESTMHTLHKRHLTTDDFAIDEVEAIDILTINRLNDLMDKYNETKDKKYWRSLIQRLPESFMQKRKVMMSYQALRNIYFDRCKHRLKEWHDFIDWESTLPLADKMIFATKGEEKKDVPFI